MKKLDHVLSRIEKDQNFYGIKVKQGAAEGSMTRAVTKVQNSNKSSSGQHCIQSL